MDKIRSRAFSWTYFYDNERDMFATVKKLIDLDYKYLCYGEEKCPDTGRKHLQGYFTFRNAKKLSCLKADFGTFHFEVSKADGFKNKLYCSKTRECDPVPNEVFMEYGDVPSKTGQAGGDANKRKWDDALANAKSGEIDIISAEMQIKYYSTFKRIERDYMVKPADLETVCGIWYYGPKGTGKSFAARKDYPAFYNKLPNKWWDGYQGEASVLIDDFDIMHKCLGHHLKIWADQYAFSAEVKGSTISIRPKVLIVTSNYHPEEIWGDHRQTLEPILDRFVITKFEGESRRPPRAARVSEVLVDEVRSSSSCIPGFRLPVPRPGLEIPEPVFEDMDLNFLIDQVEMPNDGQDLADM